MCSRSLGDKSVAEGIPRKDWTLAYHRCTVHVRAATHVLAVPVYRRTVGVHHVFYVDYHGVTLADLKNERRKEVF